MKFFLSEKDYQKRYHNTIHRASKDQIQRINWNFNRSQNRLFYVKELATKFCRSKDSSSYEKLVVFQIIPFAVLETSKIEDERERCDVLEHRRICNGYRRIVENNFRMVKEFWMFEREEYSTPTIRQPKPSDGRNGD